MRGAGRHVDVLITVDTEVWPVAHDWPHTPLPPTQDVSREIAWYLHGGADRRGMGLAWQLAMLARHGLRATYFVDPMFSFALGLAPLREAVALIAESGQEIGLHLHPEWLTDARCPPLPAFRGPLLHAYPEDDQLALVVAALSRLREAGADRIAAFRAGSWGADAATLRSIAAAGLRFDSSLNGHFEASFPALDAARRSLLQPFVSEGVIEVPVTGFVDRPPGGTRPLHVCAVSFEEFRHVVEQAYDDGWSTVVMVMHSFEFTRVSALRSGGGDAPMRLVAARFQRMCRYLAEHADRFRPAHFRDLDPRRILDARQPGLPSSSRWRTTARQVEQLASRFY